MYQNLWKGFIFVLPAILVLLCFVGFLMLFDSMSDSERYNAVTLNKQEWRCTKEVSVLRMQPAGKVMVPITDKHCVEYIKKDGE